MTLGSNADFGSGVDGASDDFVDELWELGLDFSSFFNFFSLIFLLLGLLEDDQDNGLFLDLGAVGSLLDALRVPLLRVGQPQVLAL